MTTDQIMSRLAALHKTVKFSAFSSRYRYGEEDGVFTVSLELDDPKAGLTVEAKAVGNDFGTALEDAWKKLYGVANQGLPLGSLAPPVEAEALEAPRAPSIDDEIPF
jgi:hypothetical protein